MGKPDSSWIKKKKPPKNEQEKRNQINRERQEDLQRANLAKQDSTVWLFIPWSKGGVTPDIKNWAEVMKEEHDLNKRPGKKYEILYYDPNDSTYLKDKVKSGDRLYILGHGNEEGTELGTSNEYGTVLSPDKLAQRLVEGGLNPQGVGIKVASCYSGGKTNPTPEEAKTRATYARDFAQNLGNRLLEKGRFMPAYVDGYVGTSTNVAGPKAPSEYQGPGGGKPIHSAANLDDQLMEEIGDKTVQRLRGRLLAQGKTLTQGEIDLIKTVSRDESLIEQIPEQLADMYGDTHLQTMKESLRKRPDLRASLNKIRYKVRPMMSNRYKANVTVDTQDLEQRRERREQAKRSISHDIE